MFHTVSRFSPLRQRGYDLQSLSHVCRWGDVASGPSSLRDSIRGTAERRPPSETRPQFHWLMGYTVDLGHRRRETYQRLFTLHKVFGVFFVSFNPRVTRNSVNWTGDDGWACQQQLQLQAWSPFCLQCLLIKAPFLWSSFPSSVSHALSPLLWTWAPAQHL